MNRKSIWLAIWLATGLVGNAQVYFGPERAPLLSGIAVTWTNDTDAEIHWHTDQPCNSTVEFGETTGYGTSTNLSTVDYVRRIGISNLTASTTYHVRVSSTNTATGLSSVSADQVFFTPGEPPPSATYLVEENFEGDSGTWVLAGSYDWNSTEQVLQGTYSLKLNASASDSSAVTPTFTAGTTRYVHFLWRATEIPTAANSILVQLRSGTTTRGTVYFTTVGKLMLSCGNFASTTDFYSANTTYHLWITYIASGTCTLECNTSGIRGGDGPDFVSVSATTPADDTIDRVRLYADYYNASQNPIVYFDRMLVDDVQIGSNP